MTSKTLPRPRAQGGLLALILVMAVPSLARAQGPNPPAYYAIEGARLITVSGETISEGSLVIANGVIQALGTEVTVPPEAWVIDGRGLTVYPGLVDSLTTLGLSDEGADSRGGAGASSQASSSARPRGRMPRGPEDRPETTPWESAADRLTSEDPRLEKWRLAGFTTALSAPDQGIFPGQATIINLAGEHPAEMVVATPAALRLNLRRARGRTFPSSLMGVIAYVRQVFLDAQWYDQAQTAYQNRPQGQERPSYDRTLAPLRHSRKVELPVLFPATWTREIERAVRLGAEHELNTVIYGGHQGYAAAPFLVEHKTPVLVSLKWPEAERNADPDRDVPLRLLRFRRWAPSTPRVLHEEGVPFAFYSDGLASPKKVLENVRKAVDAGLPSAAAIRALTLSPAEIFGVDDRLGSLEVGKIANLVVADGEPWGEKTKVKMVFVDGRKYEVRGEKRPQAPPEADVTGTWELEVEGRQGSQEVTADLQMSDDGSLSGEVTSQRGTTKIGDGWVSAKAVSFTVNLTMGSRSVEVTYNGELDGESLRGTVQFGPRSSNFDGRRTSAGPPPRAAVASESGASPQTPPLPPPSRVRPSVAETTVIQNATLLTLTRGTIENGSILIRDGKIARVGQNVRPPRGARIIDATGQYVLPGIIDAHSHIAVDQGVNEGSVAVSAMVGIEDVLNPDDISIYRALAGGVTSANLLHGSSNPIGGKNAVIKLRWGDDARGLLFAGAPPGIKFALGENPKRSNFRPQPGTPRRYPATRMGVMDVIRQAFTEAREYQSDWKKYERRTKGGEADLVPPRRDLKLDTLVEILEGKRLVHAHCYRADEILQLLRLAEEFGFRIATLQHVLEGYKVAAEIAAHGAGASTFADWWAYKLEAYDAIPYNAALMTEKGVVVSINSDSAEEMRHLNQEAAKAVKYGGLSETEALKLVTLNPAKQLRIDDRVGSIEVGKDADLVIYDNHPLSVYALAQKTLIDGKIYFDREEDRMRRDAIAAEKEALKKKGDRSPTDEKPSRSSVSEVTP